MHFKMSPAIGFNLDQSKILLSGNGLNSLSLEESIICVRNGYRTILRFGSSRLLDVNDFYGFITK